MKPVMGFDTSSMISIGHTDLIDEILSNYNVLVSSGIIDELTEISKTEDKDGKAAKRWLRRKEQLIIIDIKREKSAEEEMFKICEKRKIILIIDDIRALKRYNGRVQWFFSIHIIFLLFYKEKISEVRAKLAVEKMRDERDWKNNAITIAANTLFYKEMDDK